MQGVLNRTGRIDFYNNLVEASDNDGYMDWLIDVTNGSQTDGGKYYIKITEVEGTADSYDEIIANVKRDSKYIKDAVQAAYDAFGMDHPEVFWLSENAYVGQIMDYHEIGGKFSYSADIIFLLKNDTLDIRSSNYQNASVIRRDIKNLNSSVSAIIQQASGSDADRARFFSNWLTGNNAYNTLEANGGSAPYLSHTCYSALIGSDGEYGPVCEGYARSFKVLCDAVDIPCILYNGLAKSGSGANKKHMWDYVQIDNFWYGVDVTWNDMIINGMDTDGNNDYSLIGGKVYVNGMTFSESHLITNVKSVGGVAFTNAPMIHAYSYYDPVKDRWSFRNYSVNDIPLKQDDYNLLMRNLGNNQSPEIMEVIENMIRPYRWLKLWNKAVETDNYETLLEMIKDKLTKDYFNDGQCHGMAVVSLLLNRNQLPIEVVGNIERLYQADRNENTESLIGYYYCTQFDRDYCERKNEFKKLSEKAKIQAINKLDVPFELSFGKDGWGNHIVVAYAFEDGRFAKNGHVYNKRIRTEDSNSPEGSEENYFYYNDSTGDWEIPAYYKSKVNSYDGGYIKYASDDEEWRNNYHILCADDRRQTWIRTRNDRINMITKRYNVVVNSSINNENVYAFYDNGVVEDSLIKPVLNILASGNEEITIESSDREVLDYDILIGNYWFKAIGSTYENLQISPNGKIAITGLGDESFLCVSTSKLALDCDSFSIYSKGASEIEAECIKNGIIVRSDTLSDLTILSTVDEAVTSSKFSSDENSVLITEKDGTIVGFEDVNHDGVFETEIESNNYVSGGIASGTCGQNLTWSLSKTGTLTISGKGDMEWEGTYAPWYSVSDDITEVVINNGVTSIKNRAFQKCYFIKNITIADTVISIGAFAFWGCNRLDRIILPKNLNSIGGNAFNSCSSLQYVSFPDGLTSIGIDAFFKCTDLENVRIPGTVTHMDDLIFDSCTSLKKVELGFGIKNLGTGDFLGCSNLEKVVIPQSIMTVGYSVFSGCDKLVTAGPLGSGCNIEFGWTTELPNYAFHCCSGLKSIELPDNLTMIPDYTFSGCSSLATILFPDSTTSIGENAFYNCTSLDKVVIVKNIAIIGENAFSNCTSLKQVYFCFNKPDISDNAFSKVTADAFYPSGNPRWTSDFFKNHGGALTWKQWTSPDTQVFDITNALISFDKEVYRYSGGEVKPKCEICLNNNILNQYVDYKVSYANNNAAGIAKIIITGTGNYSGTVEGYFRIADFCGDNIEWVLSDDGVLTLIGSGNMNDYTAAYYDAESLPKWINQVKSIVFSGDITSIGSYAFWCNYELEKVTLPDTVTKIGACAFYQDNRIQTFSFGSQLSYIGDRAFRNCSKIAKLEIPGKISYIGGEFVSGCSSLNEIRFIGDAPVFDDDAFYDYRGTVYYPLNNNTWTADKLQQYGGSVTWKTWETQEETEVISASIVGGTVDGIIDKNWTGTAHTQNPIVKVGNTTLIMGTDFTLSYENNIDVGTATVTITGIGNYSGTIYRSFKINATSIKKAIVTGVSNKAYTGSAQTQDLTVKVGDKTLSNITDYTLSYANNTNAGTATVTITGKGNYTDTISRTFIRKFLSDR